MNRIFPLRRLLLVLLTCAPLLTMRSQTVKEVTVSQGNPYTDHISLKDDARDMDLMVKFSFDEPTNKLSVCLISYRPLFVFPTDTPCKQAVRGRKINPDKLPFVVDAEPGTKYQLNKDYWKSLPKPRGKYVFHKWIEGTSLSPLPTECKMVNDYVQQDFTIEDKANAVTVTLHDVMMMEQEPTTKIGRKKYNIVWGSDINTQYLVYVKRNPCFGLDEQLAAADNLLTVVRAAHANLASRYASGVVESKESLANFREMKQLLLEQYPAKTETSDCPDLQDRWDSYNLVVDSIAGLTVRVKAPVATKSNNGAAAAGSSAKRKASTARSLNAGYILTQARQLDNAIGRWLATRDATERADLKHQCTDIIKMTQATIGKQKGSTAAQQNAIKIFNQAVNYYHTVVR